MQTMQLLVLAAVLTLSIDTTLAGPPCKADIVFCIDNSISIANSLAIYDPTLDLGWGQQINFAKNLVKRLNVGPDGSHIGLVDFGDAGYLNFDLKAYSSEAQVLQGIDKLPYKAGKTNTYRGLNWSRRLLTETEFGKRDNSIAKVIVLITDGNPNIEASKISGELAIIRNAGIRVVVVAILSPTANEATLKALATSDKDYFRADNFASLDGAKDRIINEDTCKPLPVSYPDTRNDCKADIVFTLDNSASISNTLEVYKENPEWYPSWNKQISYAQNLVDFLKAGYDRTHIALVDFGTGPASYSFDLDDFFNPADLKKAIGELAYKAGRTNTYQGIRLARQLLTDPKYGKRDDSVPKVILLITDGAPNDDKNKIPDEVDLIKKLGIRIVVIYVNSNTNNEGLFKTFTNKDSDYYYVNSYDKIASIKPDIIKTTGC